MTHQIIVRSFLFYANQYFEKILLPFNIPWYNQGKFTSNPVFWSQSKDRASHTFNSHLTPSTTFVAHLSLWDMILKQKYSNAIVTLYGLKMRVNPHWQAGPMYPHYNLVISLTTAAINSNHSGSHKSCNYKQRRQVRYIPHHCWTFLAWY